MTHPPEAIEMKPWWKQPGEVYDAKGYPIYPGDLIRSPHFIGRRRKRHSLYHVAVYRGKYMELVPTAHMQDAAGGGRCLLSEDMAKEAEIISGYGPAPFISYEDRPRRIS